MEWIVDKLMDWLVFPVFIIILCGIMLGARLYLHETLSGKKINITSNNMPTSTVDRVDIQVIGLDSKPVTCTSPFVF
jgi:hypothetical protein